MPSSIQQSAMGEHRSRYPLFESDMLIYEVYFQYYFIIFCTERLWRLMSAEVHIKSTLEDKPSV